MRLLISALALLLAVVFALQNTSVVDVSLFFWHLRASLAIIIALCLVLGLLIGFAALAPLIWRGQRTTRQLRNRLAAMEAETISATTSAPAPIDSSASAYTSRNASPTQP